MIGFLMFAFVLSLTLTWLLRRVAIARNIMDIPNRRSSHHIPTPRGGGVAFVLTFFITIPILTYQGYVSLSQCAVLIGSGLLVAALGFFDDLGHLNVRWRLLGHFLASGLAVYGMGGMPHLYIFSWMIPSGLILDAFAIIYLVWLLNLYNFMDGIDGLASVEAVSICLITACIYWLNGYTAAACLPLILAASTAGFLYWNIEPARIFMGDAGSGFLGLILGVLSIQGACIESRFFWSWLILLGVFIVDATITIIIRAFQGAKIYEAHRTHAYQNASIALGRHYPVTLAALLINVIWLGPIALSVGLGQVSGCAGLLIAYLPLIVLALLFRAGRVNKNV